MNPTAQGAFVATLSDLVIMRRPRRAAVGVLSPRRAPKLGKIRRRACLRLIPFPGTGDVLLAPTMISHPLAYVAPTTRHFTRPPWGQVHRRPETCSGREPFFSLASTASPARQTEFALTRYTALRSPVEPAASLILSTRFASPTNLHPTQARAAPKTSSRASSTISTSPASLPWTWSP